jgi:hypothetical protein
LIQAGDKNRTELRLGRYYQLLLVDILPALKGEDSHVGILWFTT